MYLFNIIIYTYIRTHKEKISANCKHIYLLSIYIFFHATKKIKYSI